ncbi:MAG TPA: hypothetical protein VF791_00915 [Pyrinomonadaceae bacterium]
MKEQKAEGTRQKAVKAKRSWFLLPTAFCFLFFSIRIPQSEIRNHQGVGISIAYGPWLCP